MNFLVIAVIAVLGLLSMLQRVLPWILYKKVGKSNYLPMLFDLVAVSAFASLMVDNIQAFTLSNLVPLVPAILIAYKTRNLGATVLVALLFSVVFSLL